MAEMIQADYQQLEQIAQKFSQQAQATQQMLGKVKGSMNPLKNGGWIGKGSDSFFQEMEGKVIPGVTRLQQALDQAASMTKQIAQIMQQAEDDAGRPFTSNPSFD